MADAANKILGKMLERLLGALVNGPSLNCRPHASRQRLDLTRLAALKDVPPEQVIRGLLGDSRRAAIKARVAPPRKAVKGDSRAAPSAPVADVDRDREKAADAPEPAESDWDRQGAVLAKLRTIAED